MNAKTRQEWTAWAQRRLATRGFEADMATLEAEQSRPKPALLKPKAPIPATPKSALTSSAGRLYPLVLLCEAEGLPAPIPEFLFARERGRLYRADYAWERERVIVEVDGGAWTQGRHTRGEGFIEDQRKLNLAAVLGYRVIRVTPDRLGEAIECLREMLL